MIKKIYKKLIRKFPYVKEVYAEYTELHHKLAWPPGHYYSPIYTGENESLRNIKEIRGIDFLEDRQIHLLKSMVHFLEEFPKGGHLRYHFNNEFYTGYDAMTLFGFVMHFNPKRIIEIGSGYSSALMLDIDEVYNKGIDFTFIEPNPERLLELIKSHEVSKVIQEKIQQVDLNIFSSLAENDFLFIDTSHVSKTNSDVNHIIFNILPELKPGVLIHFHDVFYPFEYPKKWINSEYRSWNEIYILRAFLMNNEDYEIIFFNHMIEQNHPEKFKLFMGVPNPKGVPVGSIWLRKVTPN